MTQQEERRKKAIAAAGTIVINGLILLLMIFVASWSSPGAGEGQYPGIEVNLGYDEQGSGDIQPDKPLGSPDATDDENPPVEPNAEVAEKSNPAPVEDIKDPKAVEPETMTDPNSDVEIKDVKKEVKPVEKAVEKKVEDKPVVEKKVEKPKEVDTKAVYKGKTTTTTNTAPGTGEGKEGTTGGEGDDEGKAGDKGVAGGTEGAAVYKGRPGGGDGGPSLDLYGWNWDNIPKPNTPDNETSGRIVFTIEVDENGELIRYRKESGTVSAAAERACVESLQKLTFTKKSGAKVPPVSKGKITFVIRAQ
jgi:periplasmic protein TonB